MKPLRSAATLALFVSLSSLALVRAAEEPLFPALEAGETPFAQAVRSLNRIGHALLAAREREVAALTTRERLDARRQRARDTLLRLMGGLPEARTPLQARVTGRHDGEGFRVENVIFESLPGFPVTANLYLPPGPGPFPAVLDSMGHGEGKSADRLGPDLARAGFAVLAYDPLGQGERLQNYDPELRVSRAGSATDEHGQAALRSELIGESVARYFLWDAVRGLDYLESRPEVDRARIGAAGCSGGGTVTTYVAALDERVKAAAVACYITSWSALLDGPGPQEAEQTLAGFLAEGLDMGDYVALIAPRPLLIASTRDDFFPLEGARFVHEEGLRHYAVLGAQERLSWSVGPGGHGVHREGREAIEVFFLRWLAGGKDGASDRPDARLRPDDLACTETGQVSTALGARGVADLVAERARKMLRRVDPPATAADLEAQTSRTRAAVARLLGIQPQPAAAPPMLTTHKTVERAGYRLEVVSFPAEEGVATWGLLAIPAAPGRKPAVLLADPRLRANDAATDLDALARDGHVVLGLELRGALTAREQPARPSLLGPYVALHRRAQAVGRSLVGMRAQDVLRGVDVLAARADVDAGRIGALGVQGFGVPVLHAAALDARIARVLLQDAPLGYRGYLEHGVHRDLAEAVVGGALREYDLPDLLLSISPRPVTLVNPTDAVGVPLGGLERVRALGPTVATLRELGRGQPRTARRRPGEPLRWE